jgi:peptidoglycan/LPS O-acetylase OafA/YrhL
MHRRTPYLQGLRGVAAFVVLVYHFLLAFYPAAVFGRQAPAHGAWEHSFWVTPLGLLAAGQAAVCLFFILSGYVLSLPYFGPKAEGSNHLLAAMAKRPFRLIGLVLACMILSQGLARGHFYHYQELEAAVGGAAHAGGPFSTASSWRHFLKVLLLNPFGTASAFDAPLWTIPLELVGSYATYIFLLLFRQSRYRGWAYLIAGAELSNYFLFEFILGIALADLCTNFPTIVQRCSRAPVALTLGAAGIFLAGFPYMVPTQDLAGSWYAHLPPLFVRDLYPLTGAGLIFAAVLTSRSCQRCLASAPCVFLGRISYALYAVHFIVIGSFSSVLYLHLRRAHGHDGSVIVTVASSVALIAILSVILTLFLDEPLVRASNQLAKRWLAERLTWTPEQALKPTASLPAAAPAIPAAHRG